MPDPHRSLLGILLEEVRREGPRPFSRVMELALYHPEYGYYSRLEESPDYYTSADVHPLFAQILAGFIAELWKTEFAREPVFSVVELGAGTGRLAGRILQCLRSDYPDCYERLRYTAIEAGTRRLDRCRSLGGSFPDRFEAAADFDFGDGAISGLIFSNEFFDALPFERVQNRGGTLLELRAAEKKGQLEDTAVPLSAELSEYFSWLGASPAPGCRGEAQPATRLWARRIFRALNHGAVLTLDYGYASEELYAPIRSEGTALAHFHHRTNRDFYARLGEQDLTCHFNFSVLAREGESFGLRTDTLKTQSEFLLSSGLERILESVRAAGDAKSRLKASAAARSLIHPEGMGGVFKILLQRRQASGI